ncbi:acyl-CoA dehydrogenase family protein [Amycolatopsis anabasis]|uniref:acyl-CoA dehydrogenase family protein n=1 Tax=Amycolatopsis anabasis TaxID=1840409 RepID=UPI001C55108C|nr:acyl-CoA dehydrogenase family protein [Amycolatopsis anabasis]
MIAPAPWADCRRVTRSAGIAAGLEVLCDSLAPGGLPCGPRGHAVVPARRAEAAGGGPVFARDLLEAEGVVALRPSGAGFPADSRWVTALAWLRLGASEALTDDCLAYLGSRTAGGEPLLDRQLVAGQLADALIEQLEAGAVLEGAAPETLGPGGLRLVHGQLTTTDRLLLRLLGAAGFRTDGPGRRALLSELLADAYLDRNAEEDRM